MSQPTLSDLYKLQTELNQLRHRHSNMLVNQNLAKFFDSLLIKIGIAISNLQLKKENLELF